MKTVLKLLLGFVIFSLVLHLGALLQSRKYLTEFVDCSDKTVEERMKIMREGNIREYYLKRYGLPADAEVSRELISSDLWSDVAQCLKDKI